MSRCSERCGAVDGRPCQPQTKGEEVMKSEENNTNAQAAVIDIYADGVGKVAFEKVRAKAKAIPPKQLKPLRLDLRSVAIVLLGVNDVLEDPKVRECFEALPDRLFDPKHLDELAELALAGWYVRDTRLDATARAEAAYMPPELVEAAVEVRARMHKQARYYLGDDPKCAAELRGVRGGRSHADLVSDLTRLAGVFEDNRFVLERDTKLYRPTDVADARRYAWELIERLGERSVDHWSSMSVRVWTLLDACYREVRTAARFLFRGEPELARRFPSLYRATRAKPRDRSEPDGTDVEVTGGPTPSASESGSDAGSATGDPVTSGIPAGP